MDQYQRRFADLMNLQEDSDADPIPLCEFAEEKLRFHLSGSMVSTLSGLGFVIQQQTPDFKAVSDFLGQRYNYWTDDIPHPDYGF